MNTYSDYTASCLSPSLYKQPLEKTGLVVERDKTSEVQLGKHLRLALMRLLLNPSSSLCEKINAHLRILHQRVMIGVQIRLGGQKANFVEREMMPADTVDQAVSLIRAYMRKKKLQLNDVYIFVSSDSDFAIRKVRNAFKSQSQSHKGTTSIYVVNDYPIGHSAEAKIVRHKKKEWKAFTMRAIMDLLILKDSEYLIYSHKSSYGKFAHELQLSYSLPIDFSPFLKQRGLNCSVFHERPIERSSNYL